MQKQWVPTKKCRQEATNWWGCTIDTTLVCSVKKMLRSIRISASFQQLFKIFSSARLLKHRKAWLFWMPSPVFGSTWGIMAGSTISVALVPLGPSLWSQVGGWGFEDRWPTSCWTWRQGRQGSANGEARAAGTWWLHGMHFQGPKIKFGTPSSLGKKVFFAKANELMVRAKQTAQLANGRSTNSKCNQESYFSTW